MGNLIESNILQHIHINPDDDLGVYSEAVLLGAPEAPADHPRQGGGSIVEVTRGHQRPPAVPLTRVPTSGPDPGTQHVLGHVPGHRDIIMSVTVIMYLVIRPHPESGKMVTDT